MNRKNFGISKRLQSKKKNIMRVFAVAKCLMILCSISAFAVESTPAIQQEDTLFTNPTIKQKIATVSESFSNYRVISIIGPILSTSLAGLSLLEDAPVGLIASYLGGAVVDLTGAYDIRLAGKTLGEINNELKTPHQKKIAVLMGEAAEELKMYGKLMLAGHGVSAGGIAFSLLFGSHTGSTEMVYVGNGISVLGGLYLLLAPNKIGQAGRKLEEAGIELLKNSQYQGRAELIRDAGKSLQAYRRNFYLGRGIAIGGGAALIAGLIKESTELTVAGAIVSAGGMVLSWIAPYSIGSAGRKLMRAWE